MYCQCQTLQKQVVILLPTIPYSCPCPLRANRQIGPQDRQTQWVSFSEAAFTTCAMFGRTEKVRNKERALVVISTMLVSWRGRQRPFQFDMCWLIESSGLVVICRSHAIAKSEQRYFPDPEYQFQVFSLSWPGASIEISQPCPASEAILSQDPE